MPTLYTIGHSNRELDAFLVLLAEQQINVVVDVRAIPQSRRLPWFNQSALRTALAQHHITYVHLPQLGGRREPRTDSINTGIKKSAFRGYADYMQTLEFFLGLKQLNRLFNKTNKVAVMCAEGDPKNCHRSLIADAEKARGVTVLHIVNQDVLEPHELTPFANVDATVTPIKVFYPKA